MDFKLPPRLLGTLFACTLAAPAGAAQWLAGAQLGAQASRAHLGAELPAAQGPLVHRLWLGWEEYSYSDHGTEIDLSAASAGYALGFQGGSGAGSWAGFLGLRYRSTEHSPRPRKDDDPAWELGLRLEGELDLGSGWRAGGELSSYPASRGYEVRGRLLRDLHGGLSLGPELRLETSSHHSAQHLSLRLEGFRPTLGLEAAMSLGVQRDDEGDAGPFISVEFSRDF